MSDTQILMKIAEDIGALKNGVADVQRRLTEFKASDEDFHSRISSLENTRTRFEGVRGVVAGGIALLVSGLTAYLTGE